MIHVPRQFLRQQYKNARSNSLRLAPRFALSLLASLSLSPREQCVALQLHLYLPEPVNSSRYTRISIPRHRTLFVASSASPQGAALRSSSRLVPDVLSTEATACLPKRHPTHCIMILRASNAIRVRSRALRLARGQPPALKLPHFLRPSPRLLR